MWGEQCLILFDNTKLSVNFHFPTSVLFTVNVNIVECLVGYEICKYSITCLDRQSLVHCETGH